MMFAQKGLSWNRTVEDTSHAEVVSKIAAAGIGSGDADLLCLMEDVAWLLRPMPTASMCPGKAVER